MINKRGQALLEQSESALLGLDWFAHFVPEAEREARRAGFDQMIAADGRAIEYAESTVVLKDGRQFLLAWSIIFLRDANGVVIGNLSSAEDVTERRQAESELRIAATTFESHEGMIVTDANFKILRINKAFSDID